MTCGVLQQILSPVRGNLKSEEFLSRDDLNPVKIQRKKFWLITFRWTLDFDFLLSQMPTMYDVACDARLLLCINSRAYINTKYNNNEVVTYKINK
jgi:hypothetical protein